MHGLATDRPCTGEACSTGVEVAEGRGTGVAWGRGFDKGDVQNNTKNVTEKDRRITSELFEEKVEKACEIMRIISENPSVSIDEMRISLDVTDRTLDIFPN